MNTSQRENSKTIEYPYLPESMTFAYADPANKFILAAKEFARSQALDTNMPTGTVLVKKNRIIGRGANGSAYHESNVCERVKLNIPTGQGYDMCEGCHPRNHSESRAVQDAIKQGNNLNDAKAYLWGHWWCCEPCWTALLENGVSKVYLMQNSEILFNKQHESNIVGRQFET